jgi:hypothetical protein
MVGPPGFSEAGLVSTGVTLLALAVAVWAFRRRIRWRGRVLTMPGNMVREQQDASEDGRERRPPHHQHFWR